MNLRPRPARREKGRLTLINPARRPDLGRLAGLCRTPCFPGQPTPRCLIIDAFRAQPLRYAIGGVLFILLLATGEGPRRRCAATGASCRRSCSASSDRRLQLFRMIRARHNAPTRLRSSSRCRLRSPRSPCGGCSAASSAPSRSLVASGDCRRLHRRTTGVCTRALRRAASRESDRLLLRALLGHVYVFRRRGSRSGPPLRSTVLHLSPVAVGLLRATSRGSCSAGRTVPSSPATIGSLRLAASLFPLAVGRGLLAFKTQRGALDQRHHQMLPQQGAGRA